MVERVLKIKETKQGILMPVLVVPQGKEFAIIGFDEWSNSLKIRLSEKPEKGKANQELVKELRNFFSAEIEIVKGKKQRQKMLLIHADKKSVEKNLSSLWRQEPDSTPKRKGDLKNGKNLSKYCKVRY